jgi:HJR/Mrr/RecB family endonuclease
LSGPVSQLFNRAQELKRSTLRNWGQSGGTFEERNLGQFNARSLHRKLIHSMEDFGFTIENDVDEILTLKKEDLGDYTGTTVSKVLGIRGIMGNGEVDFRQFSRGLIALGIILIATGMFLLLYGGSPELSYGGPVLIVVGAFLLVAAWLRSKMNAPFNVVVEDRIGLIVQGEVTEKLTQRGNDRVSELEASGLLSLGSTSSVRVTTQLSPGAVRALLAREPNAFRPHPYGTSGLSPLLNQETNKVARQENLRLRTSIDGLLVSTARFVELRPVSEMPAGLIPPSPSTVSPAVLELVSLAKDDWRDIDGYGFQPIMARMFRELGYEVEEQPLSGDYGADLLIKRGGHRYIVQLKKYSGSVGAPEVQKTIGAIPRFEAERAFLVTNSTFTDQARIQAKNAPVVLIDGEQLKAILRELAAGKSSIW